MVALLLPLLWLCCCCCCRRCYCHNRVARGFFSCAEVGTPCVRACIDQTTARAQLPPVVASSVSISSGSKDESLGVTNDGDRRRANREFDVDEDDDETLGVDDNVVVQTSTQRLGGNREKNRMASRGNPLAEPLLDPTADEDDLAYGYGADQQRSGSGRKVKRRSGCVVAVWSIG